MSALRALVGVPTPTPAAAAAATPADDVAARAFDGILAAAMAPNTAAAPIAAAPTTAAKPARGPTADGLAPDARDAGAGKRQAAAGREAAVPLPPLPPPLDITALAQMAAAMGPSAVPVVEVPPAAPAAPGTSAGSAAAPGRTAPAAGAAMSAGLAPSAAAPGSPASTAAPTTGAGDVTPVFGGPAGSATAAGTSPARSGAAALAPGAVSPAPSGPAPASPQPATAPTAAPASTAANAPASSPAPTPAEAPARPATATDGGAPEASARAGVASQAAAPMNGAALSGSGPTLPEPQGVRPATPRATGGSGNSAAAGQLRPPTQASPVSSDTAADGDAPAGREGDPSSVPPASPDAGVPVATAPTADVLPPVAATPTQQVVAALRSLAPDAPQGGARAIDATAVPAAVSTAAGVKVLTIQLDPGHLGPVSVTVRMRADAVDIRIAVSTPQALHILERDRHALAAAVEALGGNDARLHLGGDGPAEAGGASSPTTSFTSPGGYRQDSSSDAASTGRGRDHRSNAVRDTSASDTDDPTTAPPGAPARPRDGSLYV